MTARITTDGQGLVPERYRYQSRYTDGKQELHRILSVDVEAEHHGSLVGHGTHFATAPERLIR